MFFLNICIRDSWNRFHMKVNEKLNINNVGFYTCGIYLRFIENLTHNYISGFECRIIPMMYKTLKKLSRHSSRLKYMYIDDT